jgi:DNA-binding CsgD family transcriptional regulator
MALRLYGHLWGKPVSRLKVFSQPGLLSTSIESSLSSLKLVAPVTLLLDNPVGFAPKALAMLRPPVVVITASSSSYYISTLCSFAPAALLLEPVTPAKLELTLQSVAEGLHMPYPKLDIDEPLTAREQDAMLLLIQGLSDKEIASQLAIEPKSASNLIQNIRSKMGVDNRSQVILKYLGIDSAVPNIED